MKNYVNEKEKLFVQVETDDWAENPREWDNLWTILTWTGKYDSIDTNQYYDLEELLFSYFTEKQVANMFRNNSNSKEFFDKVQRRFYDLGYLMKPISKFEHGEVFYKSGILESWDSRVSGIAIVNINDIKKEYETTVLSKALKEKIHATLDSELDTYNLWLNGYVYTVSLMDFDGNVVDSLGGMIGYESEEKMIQEYINYYTNYNFEDFKLKELNSSTVTSYFVEY